MPELTRAIPVTPLQIQEDAVLPMDIAETRLIIAMWDANLTLELALRVLASQLQGALVVPNLALRFVVEINAAVVSKHVRMMVAFLLTQSKFLDTAEIPKNIVPTQEVAYLDMGDATRTQRQPDNQLSMLQGH